MTNALHLRKVQIGGRITRTISGAEYKSFLKAGWEASPRDSSPLGKRSGQRAGGFLERPGTRRVVHRLAVAGIGERSPPHILYTLLSSVTKQLRMCPVTDFLDEQRQQIADRLKELKPLVDEHNRLEAAASALAKLGVSAPAAAAAAATATTPAATPHRRPGRPRGSATRASKAAPAASPAPTPAATPVKARRKKPGRPKGRGTRAAQTLAAVRGQPGITIPELAAKMRIQATYLYRVLPGLQQEGKVEKKGRGWYPREG